MGFVKICGMTDAEGVSAALAAGADAIGFVFAPSVRQVTPAQAALLAAPARHRALCVAVTRHPDDALLQSVFAEFAPDVWQSDAEDIARGRVPGAIATWPVLRAVPDSMPASRLLFEGPHSGTGRVADWSAAKTMAGRCELILAGGLTPANVGEAIAEVKPFGVDVSSGVEDRPGHKDRRLIAEFVANARNAFARMPVVNRPQLE
jgi:phosphoribosylanthranilate isomerase